MGSFTAELAALVVLVFGLQLAMLAGVKQLLVIGVLAWSLGSAWFSPIPPGLGALGGSLLIVAAIAKTRKRYGRRYVESRLVWFPLVISAVGALLALYQPKRADLLADAANAAAMGLLVVMAARYIKGSDLIHAMFIAMTILGLTSLAMLFSGVRNPEDVDRFSGVTSNPNHLGIVAFMWVALSFAISRKATIWVVPAAAVLVLLSGSRGGAVALAVSLAAGFWAQARSEGSSSNGNIGRRALVIVSIVVLAFAIGIVIHSARNADSGIALLRTGDSGRSLAWSDRWQLIQERPWTGYGFGSPDLGDLSGSVILIGDAASVLALQVGLVGLLLFAALTVGFIFRTRWWESPALSSLIFAAVVSWSVEAWILGVGAMTTAVFWLSVGALTQSPRTGSARATRSVMVQVDNASSPRNRLGVLG